MATTNSTNNFDLSQYVANDKVNFLVNYNSDMSKIDAGLQTNKTDISSTISIANSANSKADEALTNAEAVATGLVSANNDIDAIEASLNVKGSNYVKLPDGTMIVFNLIGGMTTDGTVCTFPVPFIAAPAVMLQSYDTASPMALNVNSCTNTNFTLKSQYYNGTNFVSGGVYLTYIAIGRWK